jgi:single-strand DNA-binding protein
MAKGNRVYVEGRLQSRSWEDERGERRSLTEVHARRVYQLSPSLVHEADGEQSEGAGERPAAEEAAEPGNGNGSAPAEASQDDVPF